jgi:hypothetical protein
MSKPMSVLANLDKANIRAGFVRRTPLLRGWVNRVPRHRRRVGTHRRFIIVQHYENMGRAKACVVSSTQRRRSMPLGNTRRWSERAEEVVEIVGP